MPTIPWEEVREVVDAVLDLPPNERSGYLDRSCSNPSIRRYVQSLVASYEQTGDFLNQPAAVTEGIDAEHSGDGSWRGRRIGPYQILEQIGQGGMGAVYLARRADDQYQKQVAIKLVRTGFDSSFTITRFKAERQILANLDHPNIARLLDGGSTESGQPYFVMEYIQGEPLDRYCDDQKLTIAERLQLFRVVCSAVQYAHQNLIIHRDIKPGNILVTSDGSPKLLDFGIAKIFGPDLGSSPPVQTTMVRLLTPEYASPEQLRGEIITTASDVYSLGVVLYELLTGRRPSRRLDSATQELTETGKPSVAVLWLDREAEGQSQSTPTSEILSTRREGSVEKLRRRLSGDLDNIVLMALRQEPQRRYASAEQLSEDIRRHLEGLPVIARPDTFAYRSSKFIRRHKLGVAASVLLALSLIGGMAATLREARIARTQRNRAEKRFNDVRNLAHSLMFDIHDSIRDLPGSTPARKLLVTNALTYLNSLAGEAHGDVSLQRELADAYERVGAVQGQPFMASLGDTAGALDSYLKAQAIRKTLATDGAIEDQIKYAANCRTVAALQVLSSNTAAAIRSAQDSVAITQNSLKTNPGNPELLSELASDYEEVGSSLEESHAGSAGIDENYRKALEIDSRLAENSKDRNRLRNLAVDEYHIGRYLRDAGYRSEAIEAFAKALDILQGLAAVPNNIRAQRDLAVIRSNMADTFLMNGDAAHALPNYQSVLDTATMMFHADPNNGDARLTVGEGNLNVGVSLVTLGRRDEGLNYLRRAVTIFEQGAASDPKQQAVNWDLTLAYVWTASIEPDATLALGYLNKALAIDQRLAKVDTGTENWRENEAEVRVKMGDFFLRHANPDKAAESYRRAVAIAEPILGLHADRQETRYPLASAYFGLGQISSLEGRRSSESSPEQTAKWNEATSWYQRSLDTWQQVRHPAAVSPNGFASGDPAVVARQLARCNTVLKQLHNSSRSAN